VTDLTGVDGGAALTDTQMQAISAAKFTSSQLMLLFTETPDIGIISRHHEAMKV
jgi:hypothetical protein